MSQNLNARYMELGLKNGWTIDDFCNDLNIDEKRFLELLDKFFMERVVKSYKKRMDSNNKIKSKNKRNNQTKVNYQTNQEEKIEEEIIEQKNPLDDLNEKASILKDYIFKTEAEKQKLISQKRMLKEKLQKSQNVLKQILKQLQTEEDSIKATIQELINTESAIETLRIDISKATKDLAKVQDEISKLSILEIIYSIDGKIICEEAIPENIEYSSILQELSRDNLLEDLTLKDLKIASKLLAISKYLKTTTGRNTRIIIDENSTLSVAVEFATELMESYLEE